MSGTPTNGTPTNDTTSPEAVRVAVAEGLAAILPGTELGPGDNYFERGGDSFGVARLIAALAERGLPLTARDFVADPTPDGIAAAVLRRLAEAVV